MHEGGHYSHRTIAKPDKELGIGGKNALVYLVGTKLCEFFVYPSIFLLNIDSVCHFKYSLQLKYRHKYGRMRIPAHVHTEERPLWTLYRRDRKCSFKLREMQEAPGIRPNSGCRGKHACTGNKRFIPSNLYCSWYCVKLDQPKINQSGLVLS